MRVFLGTLWSAIKEVKAPSVFDVEHGIVLQAMKWNRASSRRECEVAWFFSSCNGNLGYILELQRGCPFKTRVCSVLLGLLCSCEGHFEILLQAWQGNREPLELRQETNVPFQLSQ